MKILKVENIINSRCLYFDGDYVVLKNNRQVYKGKCLGKAEKVYKTK